LEYCSEDKAGVTEDTVSIYLMTIFTLY